MTNTPLLTKAFTFSATLLLASIIGCQPDNSTKPSGGLEAREGSRQFAAKTNDFSFDFLKKLNEKQKKGDNVFISPLSLHIALGMLLNGADGQTAEEMKKAMKLEQGSILEANETYNWLMKSLPNADPKVTTQLANSIWYRNGFNIEQAYLNELNRAFLADVQGEDFGNPTTLGKINAWANTKTNGKIKKVLTEIKPEHVLFLLNALYFKGDWKYEFDTKKTVEIPFKLGSGVEEQVRMMTMTRNLHHAYRDRYSAFELPYGDGIYSMTVLLPNRESSVDSLVNSLNAGEWAALQQSMQERKITIGLPKFTLEYETILNDVLATMGMPTAFTDNANFAGISKKNGLKVSFVKQNTFVAVDEKGTEAAAVTSIGVELTSAGPEPLICDRPFVFLITEKQTGSILFMGKIVNPGLTKSTRSCDCG